MFIIMTHKTTFINTVEEKQELIEEYQLVQDMLR